MQFISIAVITLALSRASMGLKDPICGEQPAANTVGKIMCLDYLPRFSYHPEQKECKLFVYGGCGANKNNFQTQIECETKCKE
ncbi:PI-actitoxin-Afv2a-like [Drosophila subobscura]|uniref:PI-actitoxin-Afv2a-like n=1 Tax=Drosophila subobscura TaxID=7241 RepID=UPI00155AF072|nr:PI-actitoxin-Afv2a-like [Drosophila subobscura]